MTCFEAWHVFAAVVLAILAPKQWHDVCLDLVYEKWGVGPGGSVAAGDRYPERSSEK